MQGRAGRAMGREGNEERTPGHWGERESSQQSECGRSWAEQAETEGNTKNHNNYVNTDSQTLAWAPGQRVSSDSHSVGKQKRSRVLRLLLTDTRTETSNMSRLLVPVLTSE